MSPLDELRTLEAKATAAPWIVREEVVSRSDGRVTVATCGYCVSTDAGPENDAALIVAMRNALPAMLDLANAVRTACDRIERECEESCRADTISGELRAALARLEGAT